MTNQIHKDLNLTAKEDEFFTPFFMNVTHDFSVKLEEELGSLHSDFIDKEAIVISLTEEFKSKLNEITKKVLVFEFHETFNEVDPLAVNKNYKMFNEWLKDEVNCFRLLSKYPVLHKMYMDTQRNLLLNSIDLINKYILDLDELEGFYDKNFGLLKTVSINLGDTHCGGNSVAVIETEFEKLIYKPRSLKADCIYSDVLTLFNQLEGETLKAPLTLDKGKYGWQEYIQSAACSTENDVEEYYKKLGMHLGFVYVFQGSDFHYENIIAKGPDPYLIDLETLFQPSLDFMENSTDKETSFIDFLNKSVYKSLFFNNTAYPEEEKPREACGLSNTNEQLMAREQINELGTDNLHIKKEIQQMDRAYNLPFINEKSIDVFGFETFFIEGFKQVYTFNMKYKEEILKILTEVSDFSIRVIIRPTYVYAEFLTALLHPIYLKDSNERNRILSFFKETYRNYSFFRKVSEYEISDLFEGDIPYFYSYFKQDQVFSSRGQKINSKLINTSTLEDIIHRFESFSDQDCSYQITLINMALASLRANSISVVDALDNRYNDFLKPLSSDKLDEILERETDCIWDDSIVYGNQIQWVSLSIHPTGRVITGPINYNIYDGLGGIALYLSQYAHRIKKDSNSIELMSKLLNSVETLYKNTRLTTNYSAFHGLSSYIYFIDKMVDVNLVQEKKAIEIYTSFCQKLKGQIKSIYSTDFIGGLAGILKILTLLYKKNNVRILKDTAHEIYLELVSRMQETDEYRFWGYDANREKGLTGFSHGQTGICYALSEYYTICTDKDIRSRIEKDIQDALDFEDHFYDQDNQNWQDNRNQDRSFSNPFWCHGAAGILLGRVNIQKNMGFSLRVRYIKEALLTTLEFGNKHSKGNSLCHGTIGNIDILIEVKEWFELEDVKIIDQSISSWLSTYFTEMKNKGWQNGFIKDISNPGFMMGKSGQLYTLLRYKDPTIPCVLTLS